MGNSIRLCAALESLGSLIFPHYCILCGERLEVSWDSCAGIPLCRSCRGILLEMEIRGSRCAFCGRELYSEKEVCYSCRDVVRSCEQVYPLFSFRKEPAKLVRAYKAAKRRSLAPFWASLMAGTIDRRWPGRKIVPVPPRPEKIKRREWDQIEAVAAELERCGYPVLRLLQRGDSVQQKRLNREMRRANAEKAYSVIPALAARAPAELVLIDDVYTTGATVEACAKALRACGAEKVAALVIAAD
jgi:ComF family protein